MTLAQFLRYIMSRRGGVPTPPPTDISPTPFTFDPVSDAEVDTVVQSNAVLISGINTAANVVPQAGLSFRVNDTGSWLTAGQVSNGQTLRVRLTSSASEGTIVTLDVSVGTFTTGFSVTTETTTPTTADFLITNDAEFDALLADMEANPSTYGGKRVAIRGPTEYGADKVIRVTGNAQPVIFEAEDPLVQPIVPQLRLGSSASGPTPAKRCDKLTLRALRIPSSSWAISAAIAACGFVYTSDIVLEDCEFWSGYRGNKNVPFDPTKNDYPELASILPVFNSTGAVVDLDLHQPYVGDLMADGNYELTFADVNPQVVFVSGNRPAANINVVDGVIQDDYVITNQGDSNATTSTNTSKGIISKIIQWGTPGGPNSQQPLVLMMPFGLQAAGAVSIGAITARRCNFHNLNNAFKVSPTDGSTVLIEDCVFDTIYQDFISIGMAARNPPYLPPPLIIRGVRMSRCFWRSGDPRDPHGDAIQTYMNDLGLANTHTNVNWPITVERFIYLDLGGRGGVQGGFFSEVPPNGVGYQLRAIGVFVASRSITNGLAVDAFASGSYVNRVSLVRYEPLNPDNGSAVTFRSGSQPSGKSAIINGIWEGEVVDNVANISKQKRANNVVLGHHGSQIPYNEVFVSPSPPPTSFEAAIAAFQATPAYAGQGAFNNDGYVTFTGGPTGTGAIDLDLEQPVVAWDTRFGVAVSVDAPSEWSPVLGGPAAVNITNASHPYQIADDVAGTGATTPTTAAGTVTPGQFLRLVPTAAADPGVSVIASLKLNGFEYSYQARTANVATFDAVDNGGTEYLRLLTPPSEAGLRKFLIAFDVRTDVAVAGGNILAADNTGTLRLQCTAASATLTRWRLVFGSSSAVQFRTETVIPVIGEWQRHIISVDFTKNDRNDVVKWYVNDRKMEFATASVISETGALSYNITQIIPASLGLFAQGDGDPPIFNGAARMLFMDYGATYVLPDIDDAAVRDMFEPDNIGADGSGPTGSAAKLFYKPTVAGANGAGIPNAGSVPSRPLEKPTGGTFT